MSSAAALITALGALVLGVIGIVRSIKADNRTADVAEKSVDRNNFDSIIEGQRGLIAELRARLDEVLAELAGLRQEVARCEADKARLTRRVEELEAAA